MTPQISFKQSVMFEFVQSFLKFFSYVISLKFFGYECKWLVFKGPHTLVETLLPFCDSNEATQIKFCAILNGTSACNNRGTAHNEALSKA